MNSDAPARLIFLTQFYDPEPAYKGQAFAEQVRDLGYEVEVVTGFPNYPGGNVYEGYRIRPWKRSIENGIRITRLALYPSHNRSKLGRITNYLSFFLSAFLYLCFNGRRANLIYVYNPPLTAGLAAAASRIVHRCPVIVDIHDLWPDTLGATGMVSNQRVLSWVGRAAKWMYERVQFIILHTHGFREKLLERGVPADKMQTVIGWTNEYSTSKDQPTGLDLLSSMPGLKLLYAGNMGPAQALDSVLDAAEMLHKQGQSALASFCFLGEGVEKDALEHHAKQRGLANVLFLPRVLPQEVKSYLVAADALLVHLRADPLFEITLPSKTQAYMYAGKPVLMAVPGEASRLITAAEAGICATPEDPDNLAQAVIDLARMKPDQRQEMGDRGKSYYMRNLSMAEGIKQFDSIFKNIRRPKV